MNQIDNRHYQQVAHLLNLHMVLLIIAIAMMMNHGCESSNGSLASSKASLASSQAFAKEMELIKAKLDLLNSKMEQRCRP